MRLIAFLIVTSFLTASFTSPKATLVGRWRDIDKSQSGFMTFDQEGYVTLETNGEVVGGKNFVVDGVTANMRYETREDTDPMEIDFIVTMTEKETEIGRVRGIYKFLSKRKLMININFDGPDRPVIFDPDDPNQVTLSRLQ